MVFSPSPSIWLGDARPGFAGCQPAKGLEFESMSSADATVQVSAPSEELCLSFANTRYWRGSEPEATEQLATAPQLRDWLASNAAMAARNGRKGTDIDALFDSAIALREA